MTLLSRLNTLESSNLVRLAQVYPELEYLFRHALVQDAAYGSLIKPERRQLHRTVAETIERMYPDRLDELSAVLAHHYAGADERDRAVEYARRAARHAESRFAYEEAIFQLRSAFDLIGIDGPVEMRLAVLENLADVHALLKEGAEAIAVYQHALEIWRSQPDPDRTVELRLHRKIVEAISAMRFSGGYDRVRALVPVVDESRAFLREALQLGESQPSHAERVRALTALAREAYLIEEPANWDAAERYARAAVAMGEQLDDPVGLSSALDALASANLARGLLRDQADVALRRLKLVRDPRFGDVREQVRALNLAGGALMLIGEYAPAMPYLLEAESLGDHIRAVDLQVQSLSLQSQCWFRLDRWDEMFAIEDKRSELEARYPRERVGATCFEIALGATVHSLRGKFDLAKEPRQRAYDIMAAVGGSPEKWWRNQHY
jgi:tetratricopeptide (TPR) repeat protein